MTKDIKPKKILFLQAFPLWGGGSGVYTRELAYEMNQKKNFKVAVLCPESQNKISGFKIYPLELPFPVVFAGHPKWPVCKLYRQLSAKEESEIFNYFLRSAITAVEDFQPDLIHVQHVSCLSWVAHFINALYKINYIITAHGTDIITATQNKTYIQLGQDSLSRAKKIITVSNHTKKWLLDTFGHDFSHKTRTIPGGIHLENFPLDKKIKIINEKYKLQNKRVILFTGRLVEGKGVSYLIQAADKIKGHVYIIGDGPNRKNLEDLKIKMKLKNVHFLGYMGEDQRAELEEFYHRADLFVAPSTCNEALGLVILEAMSAKTPIVATRKGGIPLAVKNGLNGFLVRARSHKQISEACNKILEDDKLRERFGEASRRIVEKKFTWEKIGLKFQRIYKESYNGNHKKCTHKK